VLEPEDPIKGISGIPGKCSVDSIVAIGCPAEEERTSGDNELLYDEVQINRF
jgi:hypothetical protein